MTSHPGRVAVTAPLMVHVLACLSSVHDDGGDPRDVGEPDYALGSSLQYQILVPLPRGNSASFSLP